MLGIPAALRGETIKRCGVRASLYNGVTLEAVEAL
jgi:phosphoserine aminotransferase